MPADDGSTPRFVGPYEIIGVLGSGGMGRVYRARDERLRRQVALKLLHASVESDPSHLQRFLAEARSAGALNHPNVLAVFDIGIEASTPYIVTELIEGVSLRQELDVGPIALPRLLDLATQMADGLSAAHQAGLVHRDLKPANVMVTHGGRVKIVDFGLAKSFARADDGKEQTLTAPHVIHGTPIYMSPEQARGGAVDFRSDIFSFGAVLYEMVTGHRPFERSTNLETLTAILHEEVQPLQELNTRVPLPLQWIVQRCLAKQPDDRYAATADLYHDLRSLRDWLATMPSVVAGHLHGGASGSTVRLGPPDTVHRRERAAWVAAVIVALIAGAATDWWRDSRSSDSRVVTRFEYVLPEDQAFTRSGRHVLAISPGGTQLAYVANQQLYLRAMDRLDAQIIRGTREDPMEPVFSPDGRWLAYFVPAPATGAATRNWILKKTPVAGGAPVTLAAVADAPFGVSWRNDTIVFGMNTDEVHGIQAVPDSGGTPRTLVSVDAERELAAQPQLLDDGRTVLFVVVPGDGLGNVPAIVVQAMDGAERQTLVRGGTDPHLLPSGHLVYVQDGTLMAVRLEPERLSVSGGPVPIVEGVAETISTWGGQFAIAAAGTLAFQPGRPEQRRLVWVDRHGREQPIPAEMRAYSYPRLSPNGTQIAVSSMDHERDVWVFDLQKSVLTRLTFGPGVELYASWMPEGRQIVFNSSPTPLSTSSDLFRKAADGTGNTYTITTQNSGGFPSSISPDGGMVVARTGSGHGPNDLMILPLDGSGQSRPLLADPGYDERNGEISPDGRWIAYDSNESGRPEVYVRPFPAVGSARWPISAGGGAWPMWSRSGRELLFGTTSLPSTLMSVPIHDEAGFSYGKPQPLFELTPYLDAAAPGRQYDIAPNGNRFLMINRVASDLSGRQAIVVVTHWFDELSARVSVGR